MPIPEEGGMMNGRDHRFGDGEESEEACTCGNRLVSLENLALIDSANRTTGGGHHRSALDAATAPLEASFVHLSSSTADPMAETSAIEPYFHYDYAASPWNNLHGLVSSSPVFSSDCREKLETCRHQETLHRVAEGTPTALCRDCLERVSKAIQSDIHRLHEECVEYDQFFKSENEKLQNLQETLARNLFPFTGDDPELDPIERTEQSFRQEIEVLEQSCQELEEELQHLRSVRTEQNVVSRQLDESEYRLAEEQNSLELEARAFDNVHPFFAKQIQQVEEQVEALSNVRLHSILFHLEVDKERGLRYPLINNLRLAFLPKGDLDCREIKAAWALVLQLLLFVGTSVEFRSKNWRIIPLSFGAKLMYLDATNNRRREIYSFSTSSGRVGDHHHRHPHSNESNLASSLRALTALLDQLIHHVSTKLDFNDTTTDRRSPPIPFELSRARIGSYDLSRLEDSDDAAWARVIHCIASNVQWLTERASDWEALRTTSVLF